MRKGLFLILTLSASLSVFAGGGSNADRVALGQKVYLENCAGCHGDDGRGTMPAVPDFTDPHGPLAKQDKSLLDNITNGMRSSGSPLPMPAKGGNPSLTAADIKAVLAYMRAEFGH